LVYFRPEPISGSARMLYMRLTDWDFKGTCTAVRVSLTDPTIKAHLISEDTAPAGDDHDLVLNNLSGSGETASYEGSTFADPPYQAFQRAKGTTLTKLILDWPAAQWIGFAKKGLTLNFYVTEEKNQGEGVVVTLFLPIGYTLESTTAPAPQQISVNGNAYTFVLAPEIPSVNGDTKLTPSLKVVYESELRRKMQDYLLFVLATIFGAALQLAIDGVRTMNRKA
jgi:hypothetical protein